MNLKDGRFMEETAIEYNEAAMTETVPAEVERLAAENEELRSEIRMREAVYEIETRLVAAGARSPGLLAKEASERFQFGEDGRLANPEALVENLRRAFPEQFGRDVPTASIDAGAGRTSPPPLNREALSRMTPDEIRRLDWDEVRSALAS